MVVQQQPVHQRRTVGFLPLSARRHGSGRFIGIAHFYHDRYVGLLSLYVRGNVLQGLGHGTRVIHVVVFDQYHVVQAHAVVGPPAQAYGHLLKFPQARRSLTGVEHGAFGAGKRSHDIGCAGGNPAHALDEVQRQPLPNQNALGRACNPEDTLASRHGIAIGSEQFAGQRRVNQPKDKLGHLQTGDHAAFFCHDKPLLQQARRQRRFRCAIPGSQVLFQSEADQPLHRL